uniref:Acetoacetyl-CoA synthetase (EC) n=1 Tax=uncultured Thiotrichaceae bacterium TaxID=298394 RepID=A0A6S6UK48_9GAMM|nr:MAG: Acetoacetyl-CoA synthetase (EC [uncultured Thiotrichaceae bacterium]
MSQHPLWTPASDQLAATNLHQFLKAASQYGGKEMTDYDALWQWSVDDIAAFWSLIWDYGEVIGEKGNSPLTEGEGMLDVQWFPEAQLNYAENLLRRNDDADAIVFWGEDKVKRRVSFSGLHAAVSTCQQALRAAGVVEGDRVAGYLPNMPEAVIAMLATVSLGAVWCSASPDFGVEGVVDRFGQIEPKVLFCVDGYYYNGKTVDCMAKNASVVERLITIEQVIVVPYVSDSPDVGSIRSASTWGGFCDAFDVSPVTYQRVGFNHPLFIMFSSGTTGVPKCIVHSAGGTLLQHIKEHRLHADVRDNDRLFYFTTCGWMMWNWLVTGLASNATLLLYDGSPFAGDKTVIYDFADAEGMTQLGTSAKFIEACNKFGLEPHKTHKLSELRSIFSTGSPLAPESYDYVYEQIKDDVLLASISGGTDIISCFALGCPILPVWKGELQCRGLGMAVEVFDDNAQPVEGDKGELVCTRPFPSMPVGFWNDPDGSRYHAAYFDRFEGIWCHGDFVEITEHGGMIIHGRSDAVLNPGGVRIGTAEIYRQVEQVNEVMESIVIGQSWDNDVRVVLFVKLREGLTLDDDLIAQIKQQIRSKATPRHVPAKVLQVADIPRTKSGKIVELAVRDVVHGREVKNKESLANAEALDYFKDLAGLRS